MGLPPDSIVSLTLSRMQKSLEQRAIAGDVSQERSGLLFVGTVHDAFPRRLFLDTRLSPLDKTAWVMIRLYAQQNEGAIFPTYDELQLQLASPHAEKASRETVSRALLMLRLTGWISLCKRVRDEHGRVRGNIYAQHDEPLGYRDAETFDPGWLELVAASCFSKNKSVRMTALAVLNDILLDPGMRHRHSRLALVEERLTAALTPGAMVQQSKAKTQNSKTELSKNSRKNKQISPGSNSELSQKTGGITPGSESELSLKSVSYTEVRNSNRNVRNFTQGVNKKTYVLPDNLKLPDAFLARLSDDDRTMLFGQLADLPVDTAENLVRMLREQLAQNRISNPVGWMFTMLRRARNGEFTAPKMVLQATASNPAARVVQPILAELNSCLPESKASPDQVQAAIAAIRSGLV
ncbi:hypothetical protein AW40_23485 [Kosakonia radicincitans UMEnt01/12]|uniref:STY4528 family pathogenicity island replication protein n=1 Tax=Kosakonia radicincitans TaxID=283686 RepID=UPI0004620288|nr:STY4528 family pathogenicity island replication protein [Kosakonia radicincitans]KDE34234.1 hypothetical protein AW40_23485 [Kosakonia radicincitans UMEnt01/12]